MDFSIDHYCKINAKKTDKSLLECIGDSLSDKQDIHLCLSGGLDSQFTLMYCLELNKNITAYTYRSIWKDTILNVEDVYLAEQLAKKYNFEHHVIDIDLKKFYDTLQHYKYGADYLNSSPQLSVHFYFIELLKEKFNIDHILLGGDPPIMKYDENIKIDKNKLVMRGERFYQDIMAPYYIFCESIGVECLRDVYYHSPEAVYKSFENNLDVIKKQKIYADGNQRGTYLNDIYEYKYHYYKNIIPNLVPQRSETTGFESLKKILAQESGIYNQYDHLYRFPQTILNSESIKSRIQHHTMVKKEKLYNPTFKLLDLHETKHINRNIRYSVEAQEIYKEFITYIRENNLKSINKYSFDF